VLNGVDTLKSKSVAYVSSGVTKPGPTLAWARVSASGSMDITDCHYVSDFARDEVVPDQTPVLVR